MKSIIDTTCTKIIKANGDAINFPQLGKYIVAFKAVINEKSAEAALKKWQQSGFDENCTLEVLRSVIVDFGEGYRIWGKFHGYYQENVCQINSLLKNALELAISNPEQSLVSIRQIKGLGGQSYSTKLMRFLNPDYVVLDSILKTELKLDKGDYEQFKQDCITIAKNIHMTASEVESGIFAWVQIMKPTQRKKRWKQYAK